MYDKKTSTVIEALQDFGAFALDRKDGPIFICGISPDHLLAFQTSSEEFTFLIQKVCKSASIEITDREIKRLKCLANHLSYQSSNVYLPLLQKEEGLQSWLSGEGPITLVIPAEEVK